MVAQFNLFSFILIIPIDIQKLKNCTLCLYVCLLCYTPDQRSWSWVYWNHLVHPSVPLTACPAARQPLTFVCLSVVLYPWPTKLELGILESPCPSICPADRVPSSSAATYGPWPLTPLIGACIAQQYNFIIVSCQMKTFVLLFKFHWSFPASVQLTVIQYRYSLWLGAELVASLYLNQWWQSYTMLFTVNAYFLVAWNATWILAEFLIWPGLNTLRPRQNGSHFPDDTFKRIFLNENVWI